VNIKIDVQRVGLNVGPVQLGQPISKKTEHTEQERDKRSPAIATTAGVLYARTLTHTRALVAGIREAPDIGDLEPGNADLG
jgi:hypothetical protein